MKRLVLSLALVACKTDFHHTVDALPADSTTDTLTPSTGDPPANAVQLTITRAGVPQADISVVFQGADGSLVYAALTDDKGRAWTIAPAGSFVTAIEHRPAGQDSLTTFSAVQPGDALVLALDPTGSLSDVSIMLTVPTDAGASGYSVFTPCGTVGMATSSEMVRLTGCPAVFDLVVTPLDADGLPTGSIYAPGVGIATGNATVLGTYQPLSMTNLSFTNVPPSISYLGVYDAVAASAPAFAESVGADVSGGTTSMTTHMPVTTATELTATSLYPPPGAMPVPIGQQNIYNWHAAATTYSLDVASVLLPMYATRPVFDPAAHAVNWTSTPGGATPDVVRANLHFYRDDIPSGRAWDWHIVAPYAATTLTLPKLPVIDFDYNAMSTDAASIEDLMTISIPGSYPGFHTHGFGNPREAISGTLGRIVIESLYFDESQVPL